MSRLPYQEISPWLRAPENLQPPLEASLRTDVVVVGAGLTGLSTALALRAQGADVAVLEQDFAGSGASGRNAGHLTPTLAIRQRDARVDAQAVGGHDQRIRAGGWL